MEHTKGKWEVEFETTYSGGTIKAVLENGRKEFICTTSGNARTNAHRICQCVNSHDDLLAALKEAQKRLVFLHNSIRGETKPIFEDIEIRKTGSCIIFVGEAIAKTEEKL